MELSELTIRLLLIFFPGIISSMIVDTLTMHKERDFKIFILNAFILGLSSYFLLFIGIYINNWFVKIQGLIPSWEVNFLNSLINIETSINIQEVLIATILAIILGFLISACINHKFLHRFAKQFQISKKFGQLDVWSYTFDSPDVEWIIVRDIETDLMYQGWVEAFSETYEHNELLLREVFVYRNSTAEQLYYMEGIYITNEANRLVIEIPQI